MSATWNYAELSKAASLMGGPEKYIKAIKRGAELRGAVRGLVMGVVAGAGALRLAQVGAAKYRQVQADAAAAEAALLEQSQPGWEPPTEPGTDPARKTDY
jgi:hypothetical protein